MLGWQTSQRDPEDRPSLSRQSWNGHHRLLAFYENSKDLLQWDFDSNKRDWIVDRELDFLPAGRRVFETVFHPDRLWAGGPQPKVSHVYEIKPDNTYIGKNVGREENRFWIALQKEYEEEFGAFEGKAGAKHIRVGAYRHIRVDAKSPKYRDPEATSWRPAFPTPKGPAQFDHMWNLSREIE